MTTQEEKSAIANTVLEYSEAFKRLAALEAEARRISTNLQTVEFAFRAVLAIHDKTALLEAVQQMPTVERVKGIIDELDRQIAIQEQSKKTLKDY